MADKEGNYLHIPMGFVVVVVALAMWGLGDVLGHLSHLIWGN